MPSKDGLEAHPTSRLASRNRRDAVLCKCLPHGSCNCGPFNFAWRSRIRHMLEKQPDLSFQQIADVLNRKKSVEVPPPAKSCTAATVRRVYAS